MKALSGGLVLLAAAFVVPLACSSPVKVDSNTNWLRTCEEEAECGSELSCYCGLCTRPCSAESLCSEEGSVCSGAAALNGDPCGPPAAGSGETPGAPAICLQGCTTDAECNDGNVCAQGACVLPPSLALEPLTWAVPELEAPETITLSATPEPLELDATTDYVLVADVPLLAPLQIEGGRNVLLQGLEVQAPNGEEGPLLSVKNAEGIVHIEGVSLRGEGALMGIFVDAPGAVIQLENVRVDGIGPDTGGVDEQRSAAMLTTSASEVRVDGLSATSASNGVLFHPSSDTAIGAVRLQRVDIQTSSNDASFFHMEAADAYTLEDCFAELPEDATASLGASVWPDESAEAPTNSVVTEDSEGREVVSWPNIESPPLDGSVTRGRPPNGTFVPVGLVGRGYESPGYR